MKLTEHTAHRPYPLPDGPWVMAQTWENLLFAHWPLPPDRVRAHLPSGLELDTFEGQAWLGIVPFEMSGIHARGLPPIPYTSAFAELNVRTYVTLDGRPGVWFFSLDAANRLAVAGARRFFHLPYFQADMRAQVDERDEVAYASVRMHRNAPPAAFAGRYRPVSAVRHSVHGTLEHWLTERYCLYAADHQQRLYRGDIHHLPWPLQQAEAEIEHNTMAAGFPLEGAPMLHFAKKLDTLIWPLRKLR